MTLLHSIGKYVFSVGFAFVLSYLLTMLLIRVGGRLGFMDQPGGRRIHGTAVPRCGGIAIFLAFHATCALSLSILWPGYLAGGLNAVWWRVHLTISTVIFLIGLIDDRWDSTPLFKLLGQIAVACFAYSFGIRFSTFGGILLPGWAALLITVLWFVAVMNAFNLIDGMDGLAGGLAVIGGGGLVVFYLIQRQPLNTLVILALIGATLGFLRFNFHPARIFMGDCGSMFLGFTIAAIGLSTSTKSATVAALGVPLMAVGVPLIDTMLAVWRRSVRKSIPNYNGNANVHLAEGDADHLHHRLARRGLTQRKVAGILYGINVVMITCALLFTFMESYRFALVLVAFAAFAYITVKHLATVELWDSAVAVAAGIRRPHKKAIAVLAYPLLDILLYLACGTLAVEFLKLVDPESDFKSVWFNLVPVLTAVCFLCMAAGQIYRRVWSRARVSEYVLPSFYTLTGITLVLILCPFVGCASLRRDVIVAVFFGAFSIPAVTFLRAAPRLIQDTLALSRKRKLDATGECVRVLCYGGGYGLTLFLRALSFERPDRAYPWRIVGVIDDDVNLHNRIIHGFRVLGGHDSLEQHIESNQVEEIIITTSLLQERESQIRDLAAKYGLRISRWEAVVVSDGAPSAMREGHHKWPAREGVVNETGERELIWSGQPTGVGD